MEDIESDSNGLESKSEILSENYLVTSLKMYLASVNLSTNSNELKHGTVFDSRKYYNQCYQFLKIGTLPDDKVPSYLIDISDLSSELIKELSMLDLSARKYVLKQAVGRLFEDINAKLYHNSISQVLKVDFVVSASDKNTENEERAKCVKLLREGFALYQNDDSSEIELSVSKALRLHTEV